MVHVAIRKQPAAMQDERRRQGVELRESGLTCDATAVQTGLTRNGVFGIGRRPAKRGLPAARAVRRLARVGSSRRGRRRLAA